MKKIVYLYIVASFLTFGRTISISIKGVFEKAKLTTDLIEPQLRIYNSFCNKWQEADHNKKLLGLGYEVLRVEGNLKRDKTVFI